MGVCRSHEADDLASRAHHVTDKTLLADEVDTFDFAVFVEAFDFLQLAGWDVCWIVGFLNNSREQLLLEHRQSIGFQVTELHLIKRMVLR